MCISIPEYLKKKVLLFSARSRMFCNTLTRLYWPALWIQGSSQKDREKRLKLQQLAEENLRAATQVCGCVCVKEYVRI